ncbi:MAG: GDSL-type esterase/lipase family protein [Actinomycetes bacterium]
MTIRTRKLTIPTLMIALLASLALAQTAGAAAPPQKFYVSLGDSYAAGYQPGLGTTRNGFVYQVPGLVKSRGYNLKVVNFACAGATTTSLMQQVGCVKAALGPDSRPYPTDTQIGAATKFIKANRSKIGLITVSIGGNDVTACARGAADPVTCVGAATTGVNTNVTAAAKALRAAAGPKVKIVGTTYPDVVLGAWVNPGSDGAKNLANLSIIAFKSLINPALTKAYAAGKGSLVDVTAATGAYGDMTVFNTLAPYGSIPKPVADVCKISFYCDKGDIHLTTKGYGIIAKLVAGQMPKLK